MKTESKKKAGAPRKYQERILINHSIEADVLQRVDNIADHEITRTDWINLFIREGLERRKA